MQILYADVHLPEEYKTSKCPRSVPVVGWLEQCCCWYG